MGRSRSRIVVGGTLVVVTVALTGLAVRAGLWSWPRAGEVAAAGPDAVAVDHHTVTVVGTGDVPVPATTAGVQLGVSVHRPAVRAAFDRAGSEMAALISAVRGQGVAAADIQTNGLQVGTDNSNGTITGYQVSSSVSVIIRRVENAAAVISAATDAAGNDAQVQGVSFDDTPDAGTLQAARRAAMDAAHTQAEQWAALAGRHLGEVVSVTEAGASQQPCTGCGGASGSAASVGVPLAPGVAHVTETVTVVYALTD